MYALGKLESVFIKTICENTSNLIIDCIYKHPMLHIGEFNSNYISPILHKLSKESSKEIFLLGEFNIDLLKYESSELTNRFFDTLFSNFLSPQIILSIRFSSSSTLVGNIFCNLTHATKSISSNLTSIVSDDLPQFLILSEFFSNAPPSKYSIYTHY